MGLCVLAFLSATLVERVDRWWDKGCATYNGECVGFRVGVGEDEREKGSWADASAGLYSVAKVRKVREAERKS